MKRGHEYPQWLQNLAPPIVLPDEHLFVLWGPWPFDEYNNI
jgi:hypothetical protein